MQNNSFIKYIVYTLTMLYLANCLLSMEGKGIDIAYQSPEILYFYNFEIYALLLIFQYGYYETFLSHYSISLIIRYQQYIYAYLYIYKRCLIMSLVCVCIKIGIEWITFSVFFIEQNLIWFLVLLLILIIHFQIEIFLNKKIALFIVLGYLVSSLTIGDILYENNFLNCIPVFIMNVMMNSRIDNGYLIIMGLVVAHVFVFICGSYFIRKKDII